MSEITARLRRVAFRDYGIAYAFIALFVGLSVASSHFLQFQNMSNILDQWAAIGLLACGETICIIAGVFDLSVGAIVSVAAVVACKVANSASPTVGLLAGVATGLGLGIANGVVIDRTRINSFIGTLATSIIYSGLAIIITGGLIVTVINPHFGSLGQGELFQITYPGWVFIGFAIVHRVRTRPDDLRPVHVRGRRERRGRAPFGRAGRGDQGLMLCDLGACGRSGRRAPGLPDAVGAG